MEKQYFIEIQMDGQVYTSKPYNDLKAIYEAAEKVDTRLYGSKGETKVFILNQEGKSKARVAVESVPPVRMLSFGKHKTNIEALEALIDQSFKRGF